MQFLLVIAATCSGLDVWVESSLRNVSADSRPDAQSLDEAQLSAAGREYESFQLCMRASKQSHSITIQPEPLDDEIGAPKVWLVEPIPLEMQAGESSTRIESPDLLAQVNTITVAPDATRNLWITYFVPADVHSGLHRGQFTLLIDGKRKISRAVSVEVFDFDLPETPRCRSYFSLNTNEIQEKCGIASPSLTDWTVVYDTLAPYRISYAPRARNLLSLGASGKPDTGLLFEHLEYAIGGAHMNTEFVGGQDVLPVLPEPPVATLQDPLQLYLQALGNGLQAGGTIDNGLVLDFTMPNRSEWQSLRRTYFRTQRADKRIARLMRGPMHPYFERYTDVFAVPIDVYNVFAHEALKSGNSLIQYTPVSVAAVKSSGSAVTSDTLEFMTEPEDACDGSIFSFWRSKSTPSELQPVWIEFQLPGPVRATEVFTAWAANQEPSVVRIETSMDGRQFTDASARWDAKPALDRFEVTWAKAVFSYERVFQYLRVVVQKTHNQGPAALAEFLFSDALAVSSEPVRAKELWLDVSGSAFPTLRPGSHPISPRIVPWLCQNYSASGFYGGELSDWSHTSVVSSPANCMVYPGVGTVQPSVQLERLRDGLEDYEYLREVKERLPDFRATTPNNFAATKDSGTTDLALLLSPHMYESSPQPLTLDKASDQLVKARVSIGRAISESAKGKRDSKE
jgi:hypothetical protein